MSKKEHGSLSFLLSTGILTVFLVLLFFLSFMIGMYPINAGTVWDVLRSSFMNVTPYWESAVEKVIFQVRIPRILLAVFTGGTLAVFTGGTLAVSGASYQTLFKNLMVSPDLLGVSAGAGFGAALAMIFDGNWSEIQLSSLVFGLLAVVLTYGLASACGKAEITSLVLSGMVLSSLFAILLLRSRKGGQ